MNFQKLLLNRTAICPRCRLVSSFEICWRINIVRHLILILGSNVSTISTILYQSVLEFFVIVNLI